MLVECGFCGYLYSDLLHDVCPECGLDQEEADPHDYVSIAEEIAMAREDEEARSTGD